MTTTTLNSPVSSAPSTTVTDEQLQEIIESGNGDALRQLVQEALAGLEVGATDLPSNEELFVQSLLDLQLGLTAAEKEVLQEAVAAADQIDDIYRTDQDQQALSAIRTGLQQ